jgi:rhamnosyltransferase subunit B
MIEAGVIDRMIAPGLNEFREKLDLPPAHHIFSGWMNSPDAVLGLFPDWFSPQQPDWPPNMTLTGFIKHESGGQELPHSVKAFLEMGPAPLVFTAGSANVHGDEYFRTAAEAVSRLGERAIFLTRFPEQLPDPLPEGIMHALWVPMSTLLPRARMLVHHGGIGTTAQALKAGIPQLVTPLAHDQFDNANRLVELGIGARVNPKRFSVNRAVEVLGIMLGDEKMAAEAGKYSGMVNFDGALVETCEFVEQHL